MVISPAGEGVAVLTGALVGLVIVAIMLVAVSLRPVPPIDADFGSVRQSFTTATPPDEAFRVVEALPVSARYKLGRADAERGRVILHDGVTMSSYGYFYPVDVAPAPGGSQVTVGIKSKYPIQFGPIVRRQQDKALAALVEALKAKLAGAI
jgi:hypothetical protein